jgi:hypothetical protein
MEHPAAAENPDLRQLLPSGNPLWGFSISSLSVTRERPIFSACRRPPAPPIPVAETPSPPSVEPQHAVGTVTIVGTAVGKPQNVALILDQTSKKVVRLHVGETASGCSFADNDA